MVDYAFTDKNSSCVLMLSADDELEATQMLKDTVKNWKDWRIESPTYTFEG